MFLEFPFLELPSEPFYKPVEELIIHSIHSISIYLSHVQFWLLYRVQRQIDAMDIDGNQRKECKQMHACKKAPGHVSGEQ